MMVGLLFAHIFLKKKSEIHKTIGIFHKLRIKNTSDRIKKTYSSDVFLIKTTELFVNWGKRDIGRKFCPLLTFAYDTERWATKHQPSLKYWSTQHAAFSQYFLQVIIMETVREGLAWRSWQPARRTDTRASACSYIETADSLGAP